MLILCIGPDTFRATRRAQALEAAFRQKYDSEGRSVEHIASGKGAADEIIERAGTASLFSARRFLRTQSLLEETSKSKLAPLAQALAHDPEQTIVVSTEAEAPSSSTLKQLSDVKIVTYEFPALQNNDFFRIVSALGSELGVAKDADLKLLSERCAPDTWRAWNALLLLKLGSGMESVAYQDETIYQIVDAYAFGAQRPFLKDPETSAEIIPALIHQMRAALRIRDGATHGLHPYLVKKLSQKKILNAEHALGASWLAYAANRSGMGDPQEAASIL